MTAPARPAVPIPPPSRRIGPRKIVVVPKAIKLGPVHTMYTSALHRRKGHARGAKSKAGLQWVWEQKLPELSTSVFVIPGGNVKNTEDRLVVMNETARAVIEARRGDHATHVFSISGKPVAKMNNTA